MRIDKLLCFLRFAKTRSIAQCWIGEGHVRRNGQRVVRIEQSISVGDVLTLPLAKSVLAIEILELPRRRGPAAEARACYRTLDAGGALAIAGGERPPEEGTKQP